MGFKVPTGRAKYYWVHGINGSTGRGVILGPFNEENDALDRASDLGEVKVHELPTRNQARATQIIKAKLLRGKGISQAMQRVRHPGRGATSKGKGEDSREPDDPFGTDEDDEL